jgi:hypothetical protein
MKTTKRPPSASASRGETLRDFDDAEALALSALMFLARDMERIERFLALTGVNPSELRGRLHDKSLQLAILDHIAADESLLLQFAEDEGRRPEAIGQARRVLGGGE